MEKKKTAKSWLILGLVFIVVLFVYAGLSHGRILQGNATLESLISVIGFCGFLFVIVGVIKWFIERKK